MGREAYGMNCTGAISAAALCIFLGGARQPSWEIATPKNRAVVTGEVTIKVRDPAAKPLRGFSLYLDGRDTGPMLETDGIPPVRWYESTLDTGFSPNGMHTITVTDSTGASQSRNYYFDNFISSFSAEPWIAADGETGKIENLPTHCTITATLKRQAKWRVRVEDGSELVYSAQGTSSRIHVTWDGKLPGKRGGGITNVYFVQITARAGREYTAERVVHRVGRGTSQ